MERIPFWAASQPAGDDDDDGAAALFGACVFSVASHTATVAQATDG